MAKLEQGRRDGTLIKRSGAKAPLSAHPAFAVIVALWFAALLGIGSLILPIALIEKLVVATGLPSVLSAAQPPLGFTARAGIALAATIAGAIIGVIVARQAAGSARSAAANRSINPADLVRRPPVNAHAELGSEGFDGNGTSRRRALALAAQEGEDRSSRYGLAMPESSQQELAPRFEREDKLALEENMPVAAEPVLAAPMPFAPPAHAFEADAYGEEYDFAADEAFEAESEPETVDVEELESSPFAPPHATRSEEPPVAPQAAPEAIREDLAELGLVQLVQKLEATIEKHRAWLIEKNLRAEAEVVAQEQVPDPATLATEAAFGSIAPEEAAQAREAYFEAPVAAQPPAALVEDADDGAHDQDAFAEQGTADIRLTPIASLAGFTPAHDNEDEDEDEQTAAALAASFALPFAKPATPSASAVEAVEPHTDPSLDEDDGDDGHGSLVSLHNDFARRPLQSVRIEEPEADDTEAAVVFPGARAPDGAPRAFDQPATALSGPQEVRPAASSEETDRALREALRNLQRMGRAS